MIVHLRWLPTKTGTVRITNETWVAVVACIHHRGATGLADQSPIVGIPNMIAFHPIYCSLEQWDHQQRILPYIAPLQQTARIGLCTISPCGSLRIAVCNVSHVWNCSILRQGLQDVAEQERDRFVVVDGIRASRTHT